MPQLGGMLISPKVAVRKEAAWAISNITAGTSIQIQHVLSNDIMRLVVKQAIEDNFEVRRECVWAISNATSGATSDQIQKLIDAQAAEALCSILSTNEARTLAIALEGLDNLFKKTRNLLGEVNIMI